MKISVDREKCVNSGMCTQLASKVFKFEINDRKATLAILQEEVPEEELQAVKDAVDCCPVSALKLD